MNIFQSKRPLVIAGPCSAENEEQVINTAKELSALGIKIFRAGIWKPRTRPNNFEGVGTIGLQWLKAAKKETGIKLTTEVANAKHTEEALKAGIDILWIGARTSVNPFAVQEIADAIKGIDIPVMIKNPINPDIELWIGAVERIQKAGINDIAAIHRGFSSLSNSKYRNDPDWQIPIEFKRRLRNIPMICDPSHIAGRRDLLKQISQKAMDLNFDGMMIETHLDPDNALSDAKQQITPKNLKILLNNLIIRHRYKTNAIFPQYEETLEELRTKIDEYDNLILEIIGKRMNAAKDIGKVKNKNNITILQTNRWDSILKNAILKGEKLGLSEKFINTLYYAIHQESIDNQTIIFRNKEKR